MQTDHTLRRTTRDQPAPPRGWQLAVSGGILGWVLDAFDFFVIIFLFNELSARLHVGKPAIVWSLTLTLATRPLGALLFGALADRFGRRKPLIACVAYFSLVTVLTGIAPTFGSFLFLRALYGIGMGGYWGIGAAYAIENAPPRLRGLLSGTMQSGYPFGYLLAAVAMQTVAPRFGWPAMFLAGLPVTAAIVTLTLLAPESQTAEVRAQAAPPAMLRTLAAHARTFGYLLLVMLTINCLSHGTQDLYPDFLKTLPFLLDARVLGMRAGLGIPVLYNLGAIAGALVVGALSEQIGRRRAAMLALGLCLAATPAWAFGGTVLAVTLGAVAMQAGVQGAFGIIPAHLNELAPDGIRGVFTGFVYQLGVLLASPALPIENALERRFGYAWALTSFELCVIVALLVLFALGPERRGRSFA